MSSAATSQASPDIGLASTIGLPPSAAIHLPPLDLEIALWRQSDRCYEIPGLPDPVISVHVGGAGRVRYGDGEGWSRRTSTLGTVTYLPPGVPSRWMVEAGAVEHLSITIGPTSALRSIVTAAAGHLEVGMPDALNVSLARALMDVLLQDAVESEDNSLFLQSVCETLLRNFVRLHRTRCCDAGTLASASHAVARAIRTIEARFAHPLRVGELAAEAGLSTTYFNEVFKRTTGVTPHQYLLRVRIEHVRAALKATNLAVVEIAQNFGFASQSHLNSAFRKLTGVTPAQYRSRAHGPLARRAPT